MKSLLYVSNEKFDTKDGIAGKKRNQLKVFEEMYDSYLMGYSYHKSCAAYLYKDKIYELNNKCNIIRKLFYRYFFQKAILNFYKEKQFDNIYIRYYRTDLWFLLFVKYVSKKSKVIIEFPTFPYDSEMQKGIKNRIALLVDRFYRRFLNKYIDRAVTYSNDDRIFGIPCIKTKNGIDMEAIDICNQYKKKNGKIDLLAVASMSFWHGYDRLIEGIKQYYTDSPQEEIYLHLVGEGKETPYYKELVKRYKLEDKIFFYGFKTGNELHKIAQKCNIAVCSLGLHRLNLETASTLKSREYCAQGFPLITSTTLDFIELGSKYICYLPSDESVVNCKCIVNFYNSIYTNNYSIDAITKELRDYVEQECDMKNTLKEVLRYFGEYDN